MRRFIGGLLAWAWLSVAVSGGFQIQVSPYAANPMGLAYSDVSNVAAYGRATGVLITGRGNYNDPAFQIARKAGAEIYVYVDPMEIPDTLSNPLDAALYAGATRWPYKTNGNVAGVLAGQDRVNYAGDHMADITAGSAWSKQVIAFIEGLLSSGKFDGVFLDVIGGRLYSIGVTGANWLEDWTPAERAAWTAGAIDLVRQLDAWRRKTNPRLIIVNNNTWDNETNTGFPGEAYVNGICLEHHASSQRSAIATAGKPFGGLRRRVLVIATSTAEAAVWSAIPGVTHVSDQMHYSTASSPPVSFAGAIP